MESAFIAWLRQHLPSSPQLLLGIGDDAAVLRLASGSNCVVTTDAITEGVDFVLAESDPRRIGRKALAVNLSDLAAMAAKPVAAVVNLVLPRANAGELAIAIFSGLLPLAKEFDVAIAGGDTNTWDGGLVISITAIGETTSRGPLSARPETNPGSVGWTPSSVRKLPDGRGRPSYDFDFGQVLTRAGAKPGDAILVTGEFGGSILGKHFDFQPRVREALWLHEHFEIHAGTDVSDGLELDLSHIAEESGCGVVLDPAQIPISSAARELSRLRNDGLSPLHHARTDGEDFELILAVPAAETQRLLATPNLPVPITVIGEFVAERGYWERNSLGERQPFSPRGFRH